MHQHNSKACLPECSVAQSHIQECDSHWREREAVRGLEQEAALWDKTAATSLPLICSLETPYAEPERAPEITHKSLQLKPLTGPYCKGNVSF